MLLQGFVIASGRITKEQDNRFMDILLSYCMGGRETGRDREEGCKQKARQSDIFPMANVEGASPRLPGCHRPPRRAGGGATAGRCQTTWLVGVKTSGVAVVYFRIDWHARIHPTGPSWLPSFLRELLTEWPWVGGLPGCDNQHQINFQRLSQTRKAE